MWTRLYGKEVQNPYERYTMCQRLRQTLSILGVEQMVIGHTPQVGAYYLFRWLHHAAAVLQELL